MSPTIIVFPPGAGGNHLKNLIDQKLNKQQLDDLYYNNKIVHSREGYNFNTEELLTNNLTHGHFGEVMSHQTLLRSLDEKKFVILSPDTFQDRELLNQRRNKINMSYCKNEYFESEQVFLYESFMYHHYFDTSMDNIMNISITEWFQLDIRPVIERTSRFLDIELDIDLCLHLHGIWCKKNLTLLGSEK